MTTFHDNSTWHNSQSAKRTDGLTSHLSAFRTRTDDITFREYRYMKPNENLLFIFKRINNKKSLTDNTHAHHTNSHLQPHPNIQTYGYTLEHMTHLSVYLLCCQLPTAVTVAATVTPLPTPHTSFYLTSHTPPLTPHPSHLPLTLYPSSPPTHDRKGQG